MAWQAGIRATVQQGSDYLRAISHMSRGISIYGLGVHVGAFLVQQSQDQWQTVEGASSGMQRCFGGQVPVVDTYGVGVHPPPQLRLDHEVELQ